jgi:hypothetical protein
MPTSDEWTILRQRATETVENRRKGRARIRFVAADGAPIKGLEVEITQKTQDFLFVNLIFDLVQNDPPYRPDLFKERFSVLFNFAIFSYSHDAAGILAREKERHGSRQIATAEAGCRLPAPGLPRNAARY